LGEGSKCVVEEELLILWLIEIVEQLKKLGLLGLALVGV
jgi:hypothetical protein